MLTAFNAGARWGVRGTAVPLPDHGAEALRMLRAIEAVLIGPDGAALRGSAADLLGDPIRAVRWIRDEALKTGYSFSGGETLSLGSLTAPQSARPGLYTAQYEGMPPPEHTVTVTLE